MARIKPVEWKALPPLRPGGVPNAHRWYAVQTVPGRERKVRDSLEASGFGTFLPMINEPRIKRRIRWGREYEEVRKRPVPAFPLYLFVSFDIQALHWRRIHRIDDVRRIMGHEVEKPTPIPCAFMARLMAEVYDRSEVEPPVRIVPGSAVRVVDGPFASHVGICQRSSEDRVSLLLSIFGRQTEVTVGVDGVEVVD